MNNVQIAQLTKHFDKRFSDIDTSFEKMFVYMSKQFTAIDKQFTEVSQRFDKLQTSVDAYAKQVLDLTQEHLMLARKVDRVEAWVQQIAKETGVKLKLN